MRCQIIQIIVLTFVHSTLLAQQTEWIREVVKKNKVKTVLIYQRVPKTSPAYYGDPKGMMLLSETNFDIDGKIIRSVDKNGEHRFHVEPHFVDFTQDFFYQGERLIRLNEQGFDRHEISFIYDTINFRRLIFKNEDNKRFFTGLELFDKKWRKIFSIDIDFANIQEEQDSIIQVFFSKSIFKNDAATTSREDFHNMAGINISKEPFRIFDKSTDFDQIKEAFESIDLTSLPSGGKKITFYDLNGNELKTEDESTHSSFEIYKRSKNGLIRKRIEKFPSYTFVHLYRYQFWK